MTSKHQCGHVEATLIPGDGIGPEIVEAVQIVSDVLGSPFVWDVRQAGMAAIQKFKDPLPTDTLESIRRTKLALKAPLTTPIGGGFRSVNVRLREEFGLYANVRPCGRFMALLQRLSRHPRGTDAKVSVDTMVLLVRPPPRGVIQAVFRGRSDSRPSRRTEMREPYSLGTMSSTGSLRVTDVQNSSSYSNRSLRSAVSASTRVGHLVKQAMTYLETDRKAAWRCLSDASTLLGADVEDSGVSAPGLGNVQPGGLANWQARRTLAYIEANLASKMGIGDLANVVALSRSHFSRAFKHSLGLPPMAYVAVRRVERAKAMISSTSDRLAEIALACGFADQAHLNRRFRDLIGMSPGRWRRSNVDVSNSTPHCGAEVQTTAAQRGQASREIGRRDFR